MSVLCVAVRVRMGTRLVGAFGSRLKGFEVEVEERTLC